MPLAWFMVTSFQCSSEDLPASCATSAEQVLVENVGLLVGEVLEALEGLVVGVLASSSTPSSFHPLPEGVAARELASTICWCSSPRPRRA